MKVHILIREDQNDHGFVDMSIADVFASYDSAVKAM